MKKIIALLAIALATITTTQAATFATLPNKAGGQVRLTNDQGKCASGFKSALTTKPGGAFMMGCWTIIENDILVIYETNDRRLYPMDDFTFIEEQIAPKKKGVSL